MRTHSKPNATQEAAGPAATTAPVAAGQIEDISVVANQIGATFKQYAKERPDVVALWCFGIGFVAGWKMKPW